MYSKSLIHDDKNLMKSERQHSWLVLLACVTWVNKKMAASKFDTY